MYIEARTPDEITRLVHSYGLNLACFIESRHMWIVPPPASERTFLVGRPLAEYKHAAMHVAHYNRHYPKFQ